MGRGVYQAGFTLGSCLMDKEPHCTLLFTFVYKTKQKQLLVFLTCSKVSTTGPGPEQDRGHHGTSVSTTGFEESRFVAP